jgi:hypothetical protein
VHDSVSLEERGIPTAAIVTDKFTLTAGRMSSLWGLPDLPLAVIPHPFADLDDPGLRERAREIAPRIREILTAPAAETRISSSE